MPSANALRRLAEESRKVIVSGLVQELTDIATKNSCNGETKVPHTLVSTLALGKYLDPCQYPEAHAVAALCMQRLESAGFTFWTGCALDWACRSGGDVQSTQRRPFSARSNVRTRPAGQGDTGRLTDELAGFLSQRLSLSSSSLLHQEVNVVLQCEVNAVTDHLGRRLGWGGRRPSRDGVSGEAYAFLRIRACQGNSPRPTVRLALPASALTCTCPPPRRCSTRAQAVPLLLRPFREQGAPPGQQGAPRGAGQGVRGVDQPAQEEPCRARSDRGSRLGHHEHGQERRGRGGDG